MNLPHLQSNTLLYNSVFSLCHGEDLNHLQVNCQKIAQDFSHMTPAGLGVMAQLAKPNGLNGMSHDSLGTRVTRTLQMFLKAISYFSRNNILIQEKVPLDANTSALNGKVFAKDWPVRICWIQDPLNFVEVQVPALQFHYWFRIPDSKRTSFKSFAF